MFFAQGNVTFSVIFGEEIVGKGENAWMSFAELRYPDPRQWSGQAKSGMTAYQNSF